MKVGIITMHKVLNYGSALQAYALQKKLFELGVDNEIIDYLYHKQSKRRFTIKSALLRAVSIILNGICGFPIEKKKRKFDKFYSNNFILSPFAYNVESIKQSPPQYDVYLTGSDQVWNPRFTDNDTNFLLSFVPLGKKRISYASSFATNHIEDNKKNLYAKYLSRYDAISVRETSGVNIVKELTGRKAEICCDPTFLLDKEEWNKLANQSSLKIRKKYILVYVLNYMCNLHPQIDKLISSVQKSFELEVIYLVGRKEDALKPHSRLIKSAGPADFVYLFQNAEFVVTTSFHGSAFSLIFGKPFLGVVNKDNNLDSRIQSLLNCIGACRSLIDYRETLKMNKYELKQLFGNQILIDTLKQSSIDYLKNQLLQ